MRIAHFSDLHLLSLEGAGTLDFLNKRWIGGLNLVVSRGRNHQTSIFERMVDDLNEQPLDHIICTGDVTNLALEGEFSFARTLFDKLALGPANVTVLPGNHDAYVAKGAKFFTGYFSEYFRSDEQWEWPDGDAWPLVRVRGEVAVIGLSTSLATPWFTAYGVIGDKQRERLRSVLADPRLADKLRVVALHHPPAGERCKSRLHGLKDHEQFAEILRETGAELVVHGHEHVDMTEHLEGPEGEPIVVQGIQSGSYESGKPRLRARCRIYEVGEANSRAKVIGHSMRVWDPEAARFVAEPSEPSEQADAKVA